MKIDSLVVDKVHTINALVVANWMETNNGCGCQDKEDITTTINTAVCKEETFQHRAGKPRYTGDT